MALSEKGMKFINSTYVNLIMSKKMRCTLYLKLVTISRVFREFGKI